MSLRDVQDHRVALHEALGVGTPFVDEAQYERALAFVDDVFDEIARDPAHPLGGLVVLLADRIREYETRMHPWPDTSTPATVLASLMEEHGLKQSDLPEVGAQSAVAQGNYKQNVETSFMVTFLRLRYSACHLPASVRHLADSSASCCATARPSSRRIKLPPPSG